MTLREILRQKGTDVFSITPEATLEEVVASLVDHNCGSLVVCTSEGSRQMVGIITERDILRTVSKRSTALSERTVKETMTANLITSHPDDTVEKAMGVLTENRIRHLPIVEDDELVGLISIGDVVKAQFDQLAMENHFLKEYIQS